MPPASRGTPLQSQTYFPFCSLPFPPPESARWSKILVGSPLAFAANEDEPRWIYRESREWTTGCKMVQATSFQAAAFPCQPSAQNITNDLVCDGNHKCLQSDKFYCEHSQLLHIYNASMCYCAAMRIPVHLLQGAFWFAISLVLQFHWGELQRKNRPRWKLLQRHPERRGLGQRRRYSHGLGALCIKKTHTKHVKDIQVEKTGVQNWDDWDGWVTGPSMYIFPITSRVV